MENRSRSSSGQFRSFVRPSVRPFIRFDSAVHKGWLKIVFRTHMTVGSPCSRNVNRFQKRDEVAFTPCPTHFSALPRCDFPKCPTKVFRISFSVLRSQYAAVLQPEALVASVSWHSHNTGRFALSSKRITHFVCIYHESLLPFTPFFLLCSNLQFFLHSTRVQTHFRYIL